MDVPGLREFLIEVGRRANTYYCQTTYGEDPPDHLLTEDVTLRIGKEWQESLSSDLMVLGVVATQELSLLPHNYLGAQRGLMSRRHTMPEMRRIFDDPRSQYLEELLVACGDVSSLQKLLKLFVELGK